jgi:hypothetical protein
MLSMSTVPSPVTPRPKFDLERFKLEGALALRRLFFCDFSKDQATPAEAEALGRAREPVAEPYPQAYAAWRRSLLWVAGIALAFAGVFKALSFRTMESQVEELSKQSEQGQQAAHFLRLAGTQNFETIDGLMLMLLIPTLIAAGAALWAAVHWTDLRRSRRAARLGFSILFFMPLAMALVPIRDLLEFPRELPKEQAEQLKGVLGYGMAVTYFVQVAPRAFSLFPGLIRASMTVKMLLPMSPLPAWVTVLIAPFYAVMFAVLVVMLAQLQGDETLMAGILCFLASPFIYLAKASALLQAYTRPTSDDETKKARLLAMGLNAVGLSLVTAWVVQLEMLGIVEALEFVCAVLGSFVFINVVGADLMVAMMYYGHEQTQIFGSGPHFREYEQRIEQMHAAGLTNLSTRSARPKAAPSAPPPPVPPGT